MPTQSVSPDRVYQRVPTVSADADGGTSSNVVVPAENRSQKAFFHFLNRAESNSAVTESISHLRDAIVVTAIGNKATNGTIIALTGARGSEGASAISLLLARSLGNCSNRRIAWIDGNFDGERFARLSKILELSQNPIKFKKGASVLTGHSSRSQSNVSFLKHSGAEKCLDFFSDRRLALLLSEVRQQFDFTVIDMPPLTRGTSGLFLIPLVDHLYLVGVLRRTTYSEIEKCVSTAKQAGGAISGMILNKQRTPVWSRMFWKDFFLP